MREVELKFELAAQAGRKLPRTRLLRGVKPLTQPLRAIYFDTPDHRLAARGMALRVRREGDRWVQTLKSGGGANGGLHTRDEIEAERPDATVDPRLFARTPLTAALRGAGKSLQPVFEVHVDRTTWTVKMGRRDRVEVALDRGHIRHGRKRTPIHELEIESKAGDPAAVFDAADRLLDHVALHPSSVSKAQRGYALARGERAQPRKAQRVAIARNASVDTAARQIVAAALEQMQANAPRVATGSDEYLHQFRVGLRRLRGCVRLLRDLFDEKTAAAIRADSRWLSRLTGNARDWDVFVAETLPALAATLEVRESANEARAAARARLRVALESSRYAAFTLRFARWLARPAQASSGTMRAAAVAALERQHHKALRAVQGLAGLSPAQRHRVRIRLKRLRYACDALASLFPRAAADGYLKALAAIQKDLGGAMDARVAMGLVKGIDADDGWKKEARARLKAAEARSLQHVDRHVASLQRARPFWKGTR